MICSALTTHYRLIKTFLQQIPAKTIFKVTFKKGSEAVAGMLVINCGFLSSLLTTGYSGRQ